MSLPQELMEWVSCPQCQGELKATKEGVLFCVACKLCFSIVDGVVDLSLSNAIPLSPEGKFIQLYPAALFTIESGATGGLCFRLENQTCRIVGRGDEPRIDVNQMLPLDEHTLDLISRCVFQGKNSRGETSRGEPYSFSSLKRLPDVLIKDGGMHHAHAFIYYLDGKLGILDLVSRTGSFVNGREVEVGFLKDSDGIRLGNTQIRLSIKN